MGLIDLTTFNKIHNINKTNDKFYTGHYELQFPEVTYMKLLILRET